MDANDEATWVVQVNWPRSGRAGRTKVVQGRTACAPTGLRLPCVNQTGAVKLRPNRGGAPATIEDVVLTDQSPAKIWLSVPLGRSAVEALASSGW